MLGRCINSHWNNILKHNDYISFQILPAQSTYKKLQIKPTKAQYTLTKSQRKSYVGRGLKEKLKEASLFQYFPKQIISEMEIIYN
jgi:hypothetical protein